MKKIIKIIGNILSVIAVIFVIYKLSKMDFSVLKTVSLGKLIPSLLLGIFLAVISVFLLGYTWSRTVKYFSLQRVSDKDSLLDNFCKKAVCVYSKANLAKYIPGNIFQYVERNLFLSGSGLDQFDIAASTVIEILGLFFSGIVLGLLLSYDNLLAFLSDYMGFKMIIAIATIVVLCVIAIIILYFKSNRINEIIRRIFRKDFIKLFIVNVLLYSIALLIIASIMLPIYRTLSLPLEAAALDLKTCSVIVSAYIISWLAGYIVIGAPGGIGIRELVISLIVTDPSIKELLLMTAIVQRIVTIAGDAIAAGIAAITRSTRLPS